MPTYKLYYFKARGRAEISRYLFALAGVPYEDIRFEGEEWAKHKTISPTGKAPYIDIDGQLLADSSAIARLLAKRFDMMGSNECEAALIDMYCGFADDGMTPFGRAKFGNKDDPEALKAAMAKYKTETFEPMLKQLEKMLEGKTYLVGNKMSLADVTMYFGLKTVYEGVGECDMQVPNCIAFVKRMGENAAIAKWEKERPVTQF